MNKQTEALKLALEAFEEIESYYGYDRSVGAMASSMYEASNLAKITSTRIREALAEESDRHELQKDGKHPAPCARHCEANAFNIEIRGLRKRLADALAEQPAQQQEPVAF